MSVIVRSARTAAYPIRVAAWASCSEFATAPFSGSLFAVTVALVLMQACGGSNTSPSPPTTKTIAQIRVVGQPVIVFDHTTDQKQPLNIPDEQITAWREADGTVNLMIPHYEAYRMRGPDLLHLTMDPNEIYSSSQSGSQITENLYNYHHWLAGPYSLDGHIFYSLAHSQWYACLLNGDCDQTGANGLDARHSSWANTINSFVSTDGGASWQLNVVNGNHVVAGTAYYWTGSVALADNTYLQAQNFTGTFSRTRVMKEGNYYYAIVLYIHRDFTQINPSQGVYEAPIDKAGYTLIRTSDVTNPNGWQAWTGGGTYQPLSNQNIAVFLPQLNGPIAAPPQIIFDTNAESYILIFTPYSLTSRQGCLSRTVVGYLSVTMDEGATNEYSLCLNQIMEEVCLEPPNGRFLSTPIS